MTLTFFFLSEICAEFYHAVLEEEAFLFVWLVGLVKIFLKINVKVTFSDVTFLSAWLGELVHIYI